jgi:RimJ/RimL family protein N-acetyltransferase
MNVTIRPTTAHDLPDLGRLWNDGRVMRWVGFPDGLGCDDTSLRAWLGQLEASPHEHHFVVLETLRGFCGEVFYRVDPEHRRAELDIKLVPRAQARGIATGAFALLIEHVFEAERDVDAVWTEPSPDNLAARALYARCGLAETRRPEDLPSGLSYWERRRV